MEWLNAADLSNTQSSPPSGEAASPTDIPGVAKPQWKMKKLTE